MPEVKQDFVVSTLSYEDLTNMGFDTACVDETVMEAICKEMDKNYREYGSYWEDLAEAYNKFTQNH